MDQPRNPLYGRESFSIAKDPPIKPSKSGRPHLEDGDDPDLSFGNGYH